MAIPEPGCDPVLYETDDRVATLTLNRPKLCRLLHVPVALAEAGDRAGGEWVHAMHGGTLTGEILPRFTRALREQPFAYQGKVLGRPLEEPAAAVA